MLSTPQYLPGFARPVSGALLAALLLGGCESLPSPSDADPLPPTLSAPSPEEPSEPKPHPKLVTVLAEPAPEPAPTPAPIATDEQSTWRSVTGPIFDWRAEKDTAHDTGAVAANTTTPAGPAASAAAPAAAPADTARRASTLILTLAPKLPPAPRAATVPAPAATQPATTQAPAVPAVPAAVSPAAADASAPLATSGTNRATGETPAWQTSDGPIFAWSRAAEPALETAPEPQPLSAWQLREKQMRGLPGWQLNGRVAISSPRESWSAVLRWEQVGDAFHVRLSTPLGQGLVDLRGVPGKVVMRTAEGETYRAPDAETLMREVAGMNLPVSGLRYWVLAVTDPAIAAGKVDLDSDSLPQALEQSGWRIEYDRYRDTGGVRLPDRLTFEGQDLDGRLIVTQWDLGES